MLLDYVMHCINLLLTWHWLAFMFCGRCRWASGVPRTVCCYWCPHYGGARACGHRACRCWVCSKL